MLIFSGTEHLVVLEDKLSTTTVVFFSSSWKLVFQYNQMFCSREYQHTSILLQQNEKSTPDFERLNYQYFKTIYPGVDFSYC